MNNNHSFALSNLPRPTRWQVIFDGIRSRGTQAREGWGNSVAYSVRSLHGEGQ